MKPFYIALAVVAVLGIAGIVYATRGGGGGAMATEPLELTAITNATDLMTRARGISLGPETAPVQVRVFSDFMCPGCRHWSTNVEPMLKSEFVEKGRVRLTYYDFPLTPGHQYSFAAARAARCAGDQNKFWEYHDRLFATQQTWSYSRSMPVDHFTQLAEETGLDRSAFNTCLRSDQHAEVVTANKMLGEALRVGGTPTVFINSTPLSDQQWQQWESVKAAIQAAGG
jgi:protein-disulfide isomerase